MRVCAHPPLTGRRQGGELSVEPALGIEELFRPVAAHPVFEETKVVRFPHQVGYRDLVRAEAPLDGKPVDLLWPGPALRRAQHDHGPARHAYLAISARLHL